MLDISFIRQNTDSVETALKNRGKDFKLVKQLLDLDTSKRDLTYKIDQIRSAQNQISRLLKGKPDSDTINKGKLLKNQLKDLEEKFKKVDQQIDPLLKSIPNIPSDDVPIGVDDNDNQVYKIIGKKPDFDFTPKDHVELGQDLDIIDVKKASQISGSRSGYFKNQAAVLEMSLMFYSFQKLISKGFIGMIPPVMIKSSIEDKMGYTSNANLQDAYYLFEKDDLVFISSSEHSVVPYHIDEILDAKKLPLKYVNFSPCFRRESGTYGKDTRGLFRVHFFNKVEMNIFTLPDFKVSDAMCLEMLSIQQEIVSELGLHYQVMNCCTGDLPQPNRKMYDINTWFPGQSKYRETHSCSNCTDYQARRLNTKVKINGKSQYVHILNATVATDRLVLAILENFQTKDGHINIPKVLWPYTNFKTISSLAKI